MAYLMPPSQSRAFPTSATRSLPPERKCTAPEPRWSGRTGMPGHNGPDSADGHVGKGIIQLAKEFRGLLNGFCKLFKG